MVLVLTFTRKKDTPYVIRDLASFTYFTLASISVISPQVLCSWTNRRSYTSTSLIDWVLHMSCFLSHCLLAWDFFNVCLNRKPITIIQRGRQTVLSTFCNVHTWNIFFSDPLCLMYSLGRNSFRLRRYIFTWLLFWATGLSFLLTYLYYEVILALLPTYQKTVVTADITPELSTRGNPWSNSL